MKVYEWLLGFYLCRCLYIFSNNPSEWMSLCKRLSGNTGNTVLMTTLLQR